MQCISESDSPRVVSECPVTEGLDNGAWSENGVGARGLTPNAQNVALSRDDWEQVSSRIDNMFSLRKKKV